MNEYVDMTWIQMFTAVVYMISALGGTYLVVGLVMLWMGWITGPGELAELETQHAEMGLRADREEMALLNLASTFRFGSDVHQEIMAEFMKLNEYNEARAAERRSRVVDLRMRLGI